MLGVTEEALKNLHRALPSNLTDLFGDLATLNEMLPYAFLIHRASVAYRILPAPQEYSNVVFVATDIL